MAFETARLSRPALRHDAEAPSANDASPCGIDPWLDQIHCGDCLASMAKMPAESIDLVVTSPPYNLKNSTGNGLKNGSGGKWPNAELIKGYDAHDDAMPHHEYVAWQKRCLAAMWRVLRPDGAIFYNHKWRVQQGRWQRLADEITADLPVRQIIIWQRKGGINFNPGYFVPTYEVVYLIAKPKFKLAPKANALGDVWHIPQESKNPHPAPFPAGTGATMHRGDHRRNRAGPVHGFRHHRTGSHRGKEAMDRLGAFQGVHEARPGANPTAGRSGTSSHASVRLIPRREHGEST